MKQKTSKNKFNTKTIICICLGDAGYAGGEHRLWDDGGTLSWQDCPTVHKFPLEKRQIDNMSWQINVFQCEYECEDTILIKSIRQCLIDTPVTVIEPPWFSQTTTEC